MAGKRRKLAAKAAKKHPHKARPQPTANHTIGANITGANRMPLAPPPQQQQQQKQQKTKNPEHRQKLHDKPTIPFHPSDRILLIGEGDLSFAASLATHHGCRNLVATVFESSERELLDKYPHAQANIDAVLAPPKRKGRRRVGEGGEGLEDGVDGEEEDGEDEEDEDEDGEDEEEKEEPLRNKIVYNIDATKPLPSSITRPAPNRIFFNFPHVGGKSTDVNRQVRYNQSLLVAFFRNALTALTSASASSSYYIPGSPAGRDSIIVTLFEGEPYTLWNPRDLARHAGLQVDRSFRFQASAYPGYRHARTLGVIKSKGGGGGESGSAWRGEDREARSFVFVAKGDDARSGGGRIGGKRRRDVDSEGED